MSRTLVVADVHENIHALQTILDQAGFVDHSVLLGDWPDRHSNQPGNFEETFFWLKEHKDDPDKTFLLGNHDLNYLRLNRPWSRCSGYSWQKESQIDPLIYRNFKLSVEVDGWTLSHAGFYDKKYVEQCEEAMHGLWHGAIFHTLFGAGHARGGDQFLGGCVWLDWNDEFKPLQGLNQIVGHTRDDKPRWKEDKDSRNLCLDTGMKHFAIIENGEVTIHERNKINYE